MNVYFYGMQLTRSQKARWKLFHPPGKYSAIKITRKMGFDPFFIDLKRYKCSMCGVVHYWNSEADEEYPQYAKIKKEYYTLCHTCWHTYTRVSQCRICELNQAKKIARRRTRIQNKLKEKDSINSDSSGKITWVPAVREQTRVRRGSTVPVGRRGRKDKKDRGSRRRRSSRVS